LIELRFYVPPDTK